MYKEINWEAECKRESTRANGLEQSLASCQKQLREVIEYYAVDKYRDTLIINSLKKEVSNDTPLAD